MATTGQEVTAQDWKELINRLREDDEWWDDFTRIMSNHLSRHYNEMRRGGQ